MAQSPSVAQKNVAKNFMSVSTFFLEHNCNDYAKWEWQMDKNVKYDCDSGLGVVTPIVNVQSMRAHEQQWAITL